MAISLKDVESRVAVLESKILTSGYITEIKNSIIKYSNGLLIQWGTLETNNGSNTLTFPVAWKNNSYIIVGNDSATFGASQTNAGTVVIRDKTTATCDLRIVHYQGGSVRSYTDWIAIGYLITNSIRSLLGGGLGWL